MGRILPLLLLVVVEEKQRGAATAEKAPGVTSCKLSELLLAVTELMERTAQRARGRRRRPQAPAPEPAHAVEADADADADFGAAAAVARRATIAAAEADRDSIIVDQFLVQEYQASAALFYLTQSTPVAEWRDMHCFPHADDGQMPQRSTPIASDIF